MSFYLYRVFHLKSNKSKRLYNWLSKDHLHLNLIVSFQKGLYNLGYKFNFKLPIWYHIKLFLWIFWLLISVLNSHIWFQVLHKILGNINGNGLTNYLYKIPSLKGQFETSKWFICIFIKSSKNKKKVKFSAFLEKDCTFEYKMNVSFHAK